MEAAGFSDLHDSAVFGSLHRSRLRAVHGEGAMATPALVMPEVVGENAAKVPLVENDDVIQAVRPENGEIVEIAAVPRRGSAPNRRSVRCAVAAVTCRSP
jgi:hypothetical protein